MFYVFTKNNHDQSDGILKNMARTWLSWVTEHHHVLTCLKQKSHKWYAIYSSVLKKQLFYFRSYSPIKANDSLLNGLLILPTMALTFMWPWNCCFLMVASKWELIARHVNHCAICYLLMLTFKLEVLKLFYWCFKIDENKYNVKWNTNNNKTSFLARVTSQNVEYVSSCFTR